MSKIKEIKFYIDSDWDFKPPVIRIWIDDFLISERSVFPQKKLNEYLEEVVVIDFKKGQHKIIVENIKTALANVTLHKIMIEGKECPFTTLDGIYYEATLEI